MATMINLEQLLEHEIEDLYSAEEQLIEALPLMVEGATNAELKRALNEHLRITNEQKKRLDQVRDLLKKGIKEERQENKGFFERMFGSAGTKCKGMEGLIKEGKKMMAEDMEPPVKDAAIIAASQKIEHYEISGYGTAKAYAQQLGLREVERLLDATLKEEYNADQLLNTLALDKINARAGKNGGGEAPRGVAKTGSSKRAASSRTKGKKSAVKKKGAKKAAARSAK